jgi:glucosamine kinase
MDHLYLAIDGGGSATRARLTDARGTVLGTGAGGPSNLRLGADIAWAAVLGASRTALGAAGLGEAALARTNAGMGLAGACVGAARDAFLARPSPFARLVLETDAHVACLGAHAGAPGAVVIAGTGSVAHVWDGSSGRQIGGWGFPISDGGSGAWIGLEAVRHGVTSLDLAPPSPFAAAVLQALGGSAEEAVLWADRAGPADYAALVPLVLAAAADGDAAAEKILRRAAAHIDGLIAAATRLGATEIALLGGLADTFRPLLAAASQAHLVAPRGNALDGALRLIQAQVP